MTFRSFSFCSKKLKIALYYVLPQELFLELGITGKRKILIRSAIDKFKEGHTISLRLLHVALYVFCPLLYILSILSIIPVKNREREAEKPGDNSDRKGCFKQRTFLFSFKSTVILCLSLLSTISALCSLPSALGFLLSALFFVFCSLFQSL